MPTKEFMDTNSKSVVVAGRRGRYQHYPLALKLALVEQTLRPGVGVSVARIARIADYPVNPSATCCRGRSLHKLISQPILACLIRANPERRWWADGYGKPVET